MKQVSCSVVVVDGPFALEHNIKRSCSTHECLLCMQCQFKMSSPLLIPSLCSDCTVEH